jgi:chaperone required for assembly of F1-ATPase
MRKAGYSQRERERLAEDLRRIIAGYRSLTPADAAALHRAADFIGGTEFTLALLMDASDGPEPAATTDERARWQVAKWRAAEEDA